MRKNERCIYCGKKLPAGSTKYCNDCKETAHNKQKIACMNRFRANPDFRAKEKVANKTRVLIKKGYIVNPGFCTECGATNKKLQAHHVSYSSPYAVRFLCIKCHRQQHGRSL